MRDERKRLVAAPKRFRWLMMPLAAGMAWLITLPAFGGPYRDSAHGNSDFGVNRAAIDGKYAEYANGNCAHCHETHASLGGVEPAPATGPAPHTLFATSFNATRTVNLYVESDNFCFYCHGGIGQQVTNQDYSAAFGGATVGSGPQSIMAAFNEASYHNLYDIWNFLSNDPTYAATFAKLGNPCSACHNSHLARRNWSSAQPGFPLLSAISKPGDHANLWGQTQVMSGYFGYEAPYHEFGQGREPAGVGDQNGGNTPDYVGFCTSCHDPNRVIWSTTLNRELKKVNWGSMGITPDKHGARPREGHPYDFGVSQWVEPYETAALAKSNFVLSCLDCHEPHGSPNIMLLRRRVNGGELIGVVNDTVDKPLYDLCIRCHDEKYIDDFHHEPGAIPNNNVCTTCHPNGESDPKVVACRNCHFHGQNF